MRQQKRKNDDQEYWGEWLSRSIANLGKAQNELAQYVGVSDPQVTRWKQGQFPSSEACKEIADFFNVDRLRLAVTAGRISEEMAGVERLPLPDDSAQRIAERQLIQDMVTKKLSKDRDRQVLLQALEALQARDSIEGATSEDRIAEALKRTEDAVLALSQLLNPDKESGT
ncbi:helix-turn-helix domain-containing protein [Streptomyces sp. NPDC058471]|uniref:helix-turn-helix domain-containing protein n=1 Tax=Streptomyces sp. NPDC058471 TaxID=3346516 RepID=UPI003663C1B3